MARWAALDLSDDAILEQTEYAYDGEQVIFTTSRQRMHDESDPGTLQGPSGGRRSRDAYAAAWYCLEPVGNGNSQSFGLESHPERGGFHEHPTTTLWDGPEGNHSQEVSGR